MADPETTLESTPESTPKTESETTPQTFTQADLDRVAGTARLEERAKYSDYDKFKIDSEALETQRQSQLSKEETLTEANAAKDKQIEALQDVNQAQVVLSAIRVQASQMGFQNPEDAVKLVDRSGIAFDVAAQAVTGVEAALATLLESSTYLKVDPTATPVRTNGGAHTPVPAATVILTEDQRTMAANLGMTPEKYAAAVARGTGSSKPLEEEDDS